MGAVPFVKYPLPQAAQVALVPESTAGAVQERQVVSVVTQVRQLELQGKHRIGLVELLKYVPVQVAMQVALAEESMLGDAQLVQVVVLPAHAKQLLSQFMQVKPDMIWPWAVQGTQDLVSPEAYK